MEERAVPWLLADQQCSIRDLTSTRRTCGGGSRCPSYHPTFAMQVSIGRDEHVVHMESSRDIEIANMADGRAVRGNGVGIRYLK